MEQAPRHIQALVSKSQEIKRAAIAMYVLDRPVEIRSSQQHNFKLAASTIASSTHTRTERRASVWGSEFTTKVAALQGNSEETAPRLNVKLWDSLVALTGGGGVLPLLSPILFSYLLKNQLRI
jgi:hypothetical protein